MTSLKGLGNHYILRLAPKGVVIRDSMQLKDHFKKSMQSKEFVDGVSVNILSAFQKKDVLLRPNFTIHSDWENDWVPDTTTERPFWDIHHDKRRSYFGFRIKDLNTVTFEYFPIKNVDSPTMTPKLLTLRVEHRPSKINFWHCNIFICEKGTDVDIRNVFDDKIIIRMAKQVIPYLMPHALLPCVMKGKKIDKVLYHQY